MITDKTDILVPNSKDLAYFIRLMESRPSDAPDHSAKKWDKRAELWEKEYMNNRKGDQRILSALNFLEQRGLLTEETDMADIGCGPGRFAAAFAPKVKSVVGLDISEKMVYYGTEYIKSKGINNAKLCVCDFQTLDIDKAGFKNAFDIVFSSMTPAIHGLNGLMKSMEMSRAWCLHITHLSGKNSLQDRISEEVFGKKAAVKWTGLWFYALFNTLYLMGYNPEISYETQCKEISLIPDGNYAEFITEQLSYDGEPTAENREKVLKWLKANADENGFIKEVTESRYGRILWNINDKTERPDYRTMEEGV